MLSLKAPAKINWFLNILAKRPDGYHNIQSLIQCVTLFDELSFEPSDSIEVVSDSGIPMEENHVYKAATALKKASGIDKGARITLKKKIPMQAGLGGGSSDAAFALLGLVRLWELDFKKPDLMKIASSLGSDMPFFLQGPSAVATGRGEILSPVKIEKPLDILMLKPADGVETAKAYSMITRYTSPAPSADELVRVLNSGDFDGMRKLFGNDFEGPVFKLLPELGKLKKSLYENGAVFASLSGSGTALFGVFPNPKSAESARNKIKADWSAVAKTIG